MEYLGLTLLALLGPTQLGPTKQPLRTIYPPPGATPSIGLVTCCPGDLDGDGIEDLVTGAHGEATALSMGKGEVLYNLRIGFVGHTATGLRPQMDIEVGPDLDGDGVRDIALLSKDLLFSVGPDADHVFVFSGRTGALLFRVPGAVVSGAPEALTFVPDLNGDGRAEIAVASAYGGYPTTGYEPGGVTLHSGRDGSLLGGHVSQSNLEYWGRDLLYAGDRDGDGWPDFVVAHAVGTVDRHVVSLVSGATGAKFASNVGTGEHFGEQLTWIDDLDGDGIKDIATGSSGYPKIMGPPDPPARVVFLSGADLRELAFVPIDLRRRLHYMDIEALPDLDGDGIGEVLFGAGYPYPWQTPGLAVIVSPGANAVLSRLSNPLQSAFFGTSVAAGDFDGDGRHELAVGAVRSPPQPPPHLGFVQVFDL